MGVDEIGSAVQDCTNMLEESFEALTNLQEEPNIERLEIEVREIQKQYDSIKGTAQTVAFT